ncbi:hypothetical protein [Siphonobacter sp. SORGH_AS_1065]|uniref:hypothetical protein n=1 Tax=Siphonobacter sp. SORGH_AS_1065 TaxID=3041795 RepID=UPI00278AA664|nr:hypothetical protein [Siphonobacter sp. SORGH_AS_1065]MDQ1089885.1 hypothetical protein [Siphonobacter sp. SORGH_AS_1065]
MKKILLFIWMILGGIISIYAQEKKEQPAPPPAIPIEFLPGSDRFYFQSILSRDIPLTNNKLRFISVINYATEYHNENAFKNDFVSVNTISYKITKHIGVGPSAANVAGLGWIPSVGFQFGWRKPSWALTFNPAISINKHTNTNNVLILEYFPTISKNNSWRLYSRFQALYIHQLVNDTHMRSSYFGRLGVSYKQFTIGAGVNVDYYTASKKQKQNYGPFLRILL